MLPFRHQTAVLRIPPNVKHGDGLVCSHEGCQRKGIKFLYCSVCKTPVAKANFGNRHKHGNDTKNPTSLAATMEARPQAAAAAASSGAATTTRKRGRPPKVISIQQKQLQQQTKRSKQSKDATRSRQQDPDVQQGSASSNQDGSSQVRTPSRNIDWDALMAGQFQQMSSSERLDLWRYMLDNRPSPTSSPTGQATTAISNASGSLSVLSSGPRALREWLDRILWMSDPENWKQRGSTDARSTSQEGENSDAAPAKEGIGEVQEEEVREEDVDEKPGDNDSNSNQSEGN